MYINRLSYNSLSRYLQQFPVIGIMGPRQSGKTTLLKNYFDAKYEYVSFDDFQIVQLFEADPLKFINRYNRYVIFDEAQYVPALFPLIKQVVDDNRSDYGRFILTGSGQFLLSKNISESLAGRIGLLPLMPLQYAEMPNEHQLDMIFKGGYPELVATNYPDSRAWFNSYLNTYIQKDLRQMLKIVDLKEFGIFVRLLAAYATQTLNLSSISREIGVSVPTLSKWLSILEASYIVFLLHPYYNNLGKRLTKNPKLYFVDNGLLAHLTGMNSREQFENGILYGAMFENFIVSEFVKRNYHEAMYADLYYLRTNHGDEIDLIIEKNAEKLFIEIKASETYNTRFHQTLDKLAPVGTKKIVVYQGKTNMVLQDVQAMNYHDFLFL